MASTNSETANPILYQGEDFVPDDIPELLKDDWMVKYFRCRYVDREACMASFTDIQKRDRIKRELERIRELRESFEEDERTKSSMEIFKFQQAQWRDDAFKSHREELDGLETKMDKMMAQKKPKITSETRNARLELEKRILEAVGHWTRETLPPKRPISDEAEAASKDPKPSFFHKIKEKFQKPPPKPKVIPKIYPESEPGQEKTFSIPGDSYGIAITKVTLSKKSPHGESPFFEMKSTERYSLKDILERKHENPLKKIDGTDTIRYFHFPANNMHWVEEAIARYYDETTPGEFNYRQSLNPPYCKKASNILCRKYWTSLQHGGVYDPVHARHLRPHCSLITPENGSSADQIKGSKNFVMFMPYLHWETHRRRKAMAKIVKEITYQHHRDRSHVTESLREELAEWTAEIMMRHARQLTDLPNLDVTETGFSTKRPRDPEEPMTRQKSARRSLGRYLLEAAKIYDLMDIEPDVRVLRDHLHKDPPLHARRTLDQSYYWKLPTTDGRDQDQVVYRATRTGKSVLRTSRVVMVDQLWMYVLDDNTIITSFPRRWGRNKPDWSGVHKAIRSQLEHLRDGEVQSVYDLALLIVNQCSAVFFDRTKPVDERPEVLDIFSNALSHVSGMKTVAFETFWRQLNKLSASDHQQEDFEATARTYLNINPEGELLRETHDIIEELRMMMGIFNQQIHVIEDFSRHLQNLHEKETSRESTNEGASPSMLKVLMDIKKLLEDQQAAKEEEDRVNASHTSPSNGSSNLTSAIDGSLHVNHHDKTSSAGRTIPNHTLHFAEDVSRDMKYRRDELQKLEESTVYVCDQLKALLDLKQQQASIIEAKYALKRADEGVTQGRSIMLFTIITIIFLPLSFMSSVFGMNAAEFSSPDGGNSMSLKHQFRLLFPISLGVIVISIALAFSTWIRSMISFVTSILFAFLFEYTHLRRLWNFFAKNRKSDALHVKQQKIVERIYSRKERTVMLRHWQRAKEREKAEKEGEGTEGGWGKRGGGGGGAGGGTGGGAGNNNGNGNANSNYAGAQMTGGLGVVGTRIANGGIATNGGGGSEPTSTGRGLGWRMRHGNTNAHERFEMDHLNGKGTAGTGQTPPQSRDALGRLGIVLGSRSPRSSQTVLSPV